MEPAEDASLEPAIQWLAESILASPLIHLQAPWVREAGLAEEMEGLKSEVYGVQLVVSVIKGRALGNKPLSESLDDLKELLYDADDVVDELDYWRLLQLDQEDDQADRSTENADVPTTSGTLPEPHVPDGQRTQLVEISGRNAAALSTSVGKLRSTLWKEFEIIEFEQNGAPARAKCIHCKTELACPTKQGTGVLQNHLKSKACLNKKREGSDPLSTAADATTNPAPPVATDNLLSSKKRRRDEESISLITAKTNLWNKDDFSKMIGDITIKLRRIREGLIPVLTILGPDFASSSNHSQGATSEQHRRTSGILQGRVYGRDSEKATIIELMEEKKFTTGATILPILGIAGVGKTALAQLVYNHPAVKEQFDHMVWLWVSNNFDAMELMKNMLGSVSQETHVGLCNFAKLQDIFEIRIKSKRVLLILDDVWDGINDYQWNQLLAPFNSDNARDNMIIITTRKPCVAKRRGTVRPIKLGALKIADFWLLFEACALGDVDHKQKKILSDLGQQIAPKLKGNPLAAKTAGALLSDHRTVTHWSSILKNEDWKSLIITGGIMSSLKLCYERLPYHLQQCFSYCSLFPCNYKFLAEELVRIWISQGFVKCNSSGKRLVEIGQDYLAALVNLGFFEQDEEESALGCTQNSFVMCNLMHDFARVVSRAECAIIYGLECNRMFPTVRHLSIINNSIYQMEDQTGNIDLIENFEEILRNTVTSVGKLRSLVLIGKYGSSFFQFFETAFQKAHNLRLLHSSAASTDFCSFSCNLVNPAHLRHLKLENDHAEQGALPQVLSKSLQLQVLDVNKYSGAWLASLQTFHLDNSRERQIPPSLERLRCLRRLRLSNMQNVKKVYVPSLEELVLFQMPKLKTCSCAPEGNLKSSLRVLEIESCPALEVLDLFQEVHNSWLPSLQKLIICHCPHLDVMIPLPPSATVVNIEESSSRQVLKIMPNSVLGEPPCGIILDDKFLSFHNMRGLQHLEINDCCTLVSISLRTFGHLISLKSLTVMYCQKLLSSYGDLVPSNDDVLPSLESITIESCGITGKWLSLMLQRSPTLKKLHLVKCVQSVQLQIEEDIESSVISAFEASSSGYNSLTSSDPDRLFRIPLNLTSSLRELTIKNCPCLMFDVSWEGFARFTSLEKLTISWCPGLFLSSVHNGGQANGRWLLPQSLEELFMGWYPHETLRPCFVGNVTRLKKLEVSRCSLKSLQLEFCREMGYLRIWNCESLTALEGLRSLVNLRELHVVGSPVLASLATSGEGSECSQLSALESLHISELSFLTSSFCEGLTSLRSLFLEDFEEPRLTAEQEKALLLHGSLQVLVFRECAELLDLPACLHRLHSLKTLKIKYCNAISGLPEAGLPPSLEELKVEVFSSELSAQCRSLATGRLRVKIDGKYVN
ncbi:unnamed protein product [Alopecurus aequalis]